MRTLTIKNTKDLPNVTLDKEQNIFEFKGVSIPKNPRMFYSPILDWFKSYASNPLDKTKIHFEFEAMNSGTKLMLVKIMQCLNEINLTGNRVELTWCYDELDDTTLRFGVILSKAFGIKMNMEKMETV